MGGKGILLQANHERKERETLDECRGDNHRRLDIAGDFRLAGHALHGAAPSRPIPNPAPMQTRPAPIAPPRLIHAAPVPCAIAGVATTVNKPHAVVTI